MAVGLRRGTIVQVPRAHDVAHEVVQGTPGGLDARLHGGAHGLASAGKGHKLGEGLEIFGRPEGLVEEQATYAEEAVVGLVGEQHMYYMLPWPSQAKAKPAKPSLQALRDLL